MINIDFHVHTKYSFDSLMQINKIIKVAKNRNISGIVICDHDVFSYPKIKKHLANNDEGFFIIPGMEVATDRGDLIGIMLNEEIISKNFYECLDEIKSQGGISILPHPYRRKKGINVEELIRKVDWFEVHNARSTPKQNEKAAKLSKKFDDPTTVGSDAHLYRELGSSYLKIRKVVTIESIIEEISKKRIKAITKNAPRKVHYWSSLIGACKTRDLRPFLKGMGREIRKKNK